MCLKSIIWGINKLTTVIKPQKLRVQIVVTIVFILFSVKSLSKWLKHKKKF